MDKTLPGRQNIAFRASWSSRGVFRVDVYHATAPLHRYVDLGYIMLSEAPYF
jgi:hypothetical protein